MSPSPGHQADGNAHIPVVVRTDPEPSQPPATWPEDDLSSQYQPQHTPSCQAFVCVESRLHLYVSTSTVVVAPESLEARSMRCRPESRAAHVVLWSRMIENQGSSLDELSPDSQSSTVNCRGRTDLSVLTQSAFLLRVEACCSSSLLSVDSISISEGCTSPWSQD